MGAVAGIVCVCIYKPTRNHLHLSSFYVSLSLHRTNSSLKIYWNWSEYAVFSFSTFLFGLINRMIFLFLSLTRNVSLALATNGSTHIILLACLIKNALHNNTNLILQRHLRVSSQQQCQMHFIAFHLKILFYFITFRVL